MTKTLNQIIFFFLHHNQNIFLEKNHNPPPWKLNGPSLSKNHSLTPVKKSIFTNLDNKNIPEIQFPPVVCQVLFTLFVYLFVYTI